MSVLARRRRWRVVEARPYDDCQLVTLTGLGPANTGREARLLVPFDAVEPVRPPSRLCLVRPARWRLACRALLARGFSQEHLCAAGRARIELLPHQLEPAIALIRGYGCRLLLADDVGLGKTIQAGLATAELQARGAAERVLILTPAGLREQWADELSHRFAIVAEIVDFQAVARRLSSLPYGVNPWTTWPLAIASVDYVKRAEVLPAVAACSWDVVIVDEAHGLAGDSDRHRAVSGLASRAAYVMLLTATPHNGDPRAFRALCDLGSHGDRLLTFRRTREDVQSSTRRRVHRLLLRQHPAEARMHGLLDELGRAVRAERGEASRDVWLGLAVLHKRAYSSARALRLTVLRRLAAMEPACAGPAQLELQLDERGESDSADEPPPWHPALSLRDAARERRLLTELADAADTAALRETKLLTLSRLLNRIAGRVIVFTEYRDTLMHVARSIGRPALVLHGGMSRQDRSAALRAFASGDRTILLATDAAGEGLNLQDGCRIVINLELPWNPMRLEQRIGRVDRIGQRRPVHVFHLIAAGTGEQRLLSALRERLVRARADFGAPDPLGDHDAHDDRIDVDHLAARLVIGGEDARAEPLFDGRQLAAAAVDLRMSCRAEALAEARRLQAERAFERGPNITTIVHPEAPLATVARNRHTRLRLGSRILLIWEVHVEDGCGSWIFAQTTATAIALKQPAPRLRDKDSIERLLASVSPEAWRLAEAATATGAAAALAAVTSFVAMRVNRERLATAPAPAASAAFQPGLFDQRIHHAQAALHAARQQIEDASVRRLAILERRASLSVSPPVLRLVLLT